MGNHKSKPPKYNEKNDPPQFISSLREEAKIINKEKKEEDYQLFEEEILKKINKEEIKKWFLSCPNSTKFPVRFNCYHVDLTSWLERLKKEIPKYKFLFENRNIYLILEDDLII